LNGFSSKLLTISFWAKPFQSVNGSNEENLVFTGSGGGKPAQTFGFNKKINNGSGHWTTYSGQKTVETISSHAEEYSGWFHVTLASTATEGSALYEFFANEKEVATVTKDVVGLFPDYSLGIGSGYHGLLDEFKVFNRILNPVEIEAKFFTYQNPIIRTSSEHDATVGTNFSLSLAADNGPTTYLAEGLPAGLSLNVSTGQITGTVRQPGYHRVFVKAMNEHGMGSDVIAIVARPQTDQYGWPVDIPNGSDIPQNGLVLWLDADDVDADGEFDNNTDHLKLANWADKAGKDHNATQANAGNQLEIRSGQISGKPNLNVLVFDGNQSLSFPTIAQGRTFFWVVNRRDGRNFFAMSNTNAFGWHKYGSVFYESTARVASGQQRRNGDIRNLNANYSFSASLQVITLLTTDFQSSNQIGKSGTAKNFFTGNFGEILIYDIVLSTNEIETVEKYLGKKWGMSISHDTTPSPSGNPPTYQVTPANDSVTTAHLSEQILKYLRPEITSQPQGTMVPANGSTTLTASAEGKFLTYQWQKDGSDLVGETNATLVFSDFNGTQDEGNYTITVSNDFGSVISAPAEIKEH